MFLAAAGSDATMHCRSIGTRAKGQNSNLLRMSSVLFGRDYSCSPEKSACNINPGSEFIISLRPTGKLRDRLADKIVLESGVHVLGRSGKTCIKNQACSRRQLELDVNAESGIVTVRRVRFKSSKHTRTLF